MKNLFSLIFVFVILICASCSTSSNISSTSSFVSENNFNYLSNCTQETSNKSSQYSLSSSTISSLSTNSSFSCGESATFSQSSTSRDNSLFSSSFSSSNSQIVNDYSYPQTTNLYDYIDYSNLSSQEKILNYNSDKWFYNELNIPLADPYVYSENGIYYIYGSTDRSICSTVDCYTTTNFKDYQHYQNVYVPQQDSWEKCGENNALIFAPELFKYQGEYYLTYSNKAKADNVRYISIAKASSPLGPFLPVKEHNSQGKLIDGYSAPIFNNNPTGIDVLDQHYLFDDDGQIYMFYSVYHNGDCEYIVGVKMIDILTADWTTYKILIKPGKLSPNDTNAPLTWEQYISWFPVAEAPEVIKSPNGKYYLAYSVNHYPYRYYSVCYAYSNNPLGDYVKPYNQGEEWTNLLFGYAGPTQGDVYEDWSGVMSGCAHHCFFKSGDDWMVGYHAHKNRGTDTATNWVARAFAIDSLYFDSQGVPFIVGPTYNLQFLPQDISGYKNIAPLARMETRSISNPQLLVDNFIVTNHNLQQQYLYKETIVGEGYSYVILDFKKEYKIGGISIYNSSKYENSIFNIEYINFLNDNVIFNIKLPNAYYNSFKEFINPASAFNIELNDLVTSKIIICFNLSKRAQLNEIKVYGKEI